MIALFNYASGAGCGSYHQWLMELSENTEFVPKTLLNDILRSREWGPIKGARERTPYFSLKLFQYKGKPYIFAQGKRTSAEVVSVWGNKERTWCEYELLPQHKVEVFYPVETWPTATE